MYWIIILVLPSFSYCLYSTLFVNAFSLNCMLLMGKNAALYHPTKPKSKLDSEYFIMALINSNTTSLNSQCYNKTLLYFLNAL